MSAKQIRFGILLLSWFTLLLYPKKSLKKYMPATLLAAVLLLLESLFSVPLRLWQVPGRNKTVNDASFIFGPFFAGTLWVFRFTFGSFKMYMLLNVILDCLLAFPLTKFFEQKGVYELKRLKHWHLFSLAVAYAGIIYGFQMLWSKRR
ncbi:hypothetical protein [Ectobacillus ponti]|uniref:Uncharacterized protein n=1 Tax=Ectobacillus ponti TaxID=2961894 RepID=A0AA42BP15_9BACI|nr:hypothetical protein [Ectobacillus ponti]MCP8968605.1 hypothetical protein [Ectobacillus ponti]